ncbi:hypothetical protein GGR44_001952 [Sphingobium fontiphilum]|uniref:Uncharacterized protein n=1 Tax=Sphingobium fontiphilum TaxID=944425 RepID=A0A7W6DNK0_9SPHN|nr:hypothetical protein [Sphingobium fontiphilum]MBB3982289.1 hypothetical protein [Sphingobium fontiphilum]
MSGTVAAMAGEGLYNRHCALQHANLRSALPLLADAAHGGATDLVQAKDLERPVQDVHADLPSNDFASLFTLLAIDLVGRKTSIHRPSGAPISTAFWPRTAWILAGPPIRSTG